MSSGLKIHSFLSNDWKEKQPTMCNCRFPQWPTRVHFSLHNSLTFSKADPPCRLEEQGAVTRGPNPDAPPSDERAQLHSSGEESPPQEAAPQVAGSQPRRRRRPGAGARPLPRVRARPAAPPSRPHSRPSPELGVAARLVASVYSSSARKQNSHRQSDSRMSMCRSAPESVRMRIESEGRIPGVQPMGHAHRADKSVGYPDSLVTVRNARVEPVFWDGTKEGRQQSTCTVWFCCCCYTF
jgi:hypothetical protein